MTQQPTQGRPNRRPVDDPTAWVDLPTAADMLGITGEAIRQRIKRGTLLAEKREGRWYVAVDRSNMTQGSTQQTTQGQPVDNPTEPLEASYRVDGMPGATLIPLTALMEQAADFADRIERLTREAMSAAGERDALRRERDSLVGERDELRARVAALEASQAAAEAAEFAAAARPEPAATIGADDGEHAERGGTPEEASTGRPGVFRRWWTWIAGGGA